MNINITLKNTTNCFSYHKYAWYLENSNSDEITTLKYLFSIKRNRILIRDRSKIILNSSLEFNDLHNLPINTTITWNHFKKNVNTFTKRNLNAFFSCTTKEWIDCQETIEEMKSDGFKFSIKMSIVMFNGDRNLIPCSLNGEIEKAITLNDNSKVNDIFIRYKCFLCVDHDDFQYDSDWYGDEPLLFSSLDEFKSKINFMTMGKKYNFK